MDDKKNMGFGLFSLDDPDYYYSHPIHEDNTPQYYIIWIQEVASYLPSEIKEMLHVKVNSVLLVDSYLIPTFFNMNLKGKLIVFSESFCKTKENTNLLKLVFFHNNSEGVIIIEPFRDVQRECLSLMESEYALPRDKFYSSLIINLLSNFLLLSTHYAYYDEQVVQSRFIDYAVQFEELVEAYSLREKTVSFYARKIGVTEKTLTKSLQLIFNKSPKEIIKNRIIFESIRLLIFSDKNMTQIAHEAGFDASYFLKFFSQNTGLTPKLFKEKYIEILKLAKYVY
jgi:AraC family transcriptional activator of pobA